MIFTMMMIRGKKSRFASLDTCSRSRRIIRHAERHASLPVCSKLARRAIVTGDLVVYTQEYVVHRKSQPARCAVLLCVHKVALSLVIRATNFEQADGDARRSANVVIVVLSFETRSQQVAADAIVQFISESAQLIIFRGWLFVSLSKRTTKSI